MPAITSKVQICNLANGMLGNRNTINNIDTPKTDKDIVYSLWYDIVRQQCLKTMMPNFALQRLVVAQITPIPVAYQNAYTYAYEYPVRCLRLLGLDNIDCIATPPTVEAGMIFTNNYYASGAPIRFVDDITDPSQFTPEFVLYFAAELAKRTAASTTQDPNKAAAATKAALAEGANASAVNAFENKPIRVSNSRFRLARYTTPSENGDKQ